MIEMVDDRGRRLVLARPATRIVCLVPSLTQTLFALGVGERVVGVTRYCTEPAGDVEHAERVGGTKNPDLLRVQSLAPDLVVMNAEENRREDFEAVEASGVHVFVSFPRRVADVPGLMRRLGALVGAQAKAERLARETERAIAAVADSAPPAHRRVFCPIWKNPWMSFNADTYDDDVLWSVGGENVCRDRAGRYCAITLDEIAAAAPEVVLLPDEPYVFGPRDLAALTPLADTPACRSGRIHFIDGKALSWYGPRTAAALPYLQDVVWGTSSRS
jgi:ABC-type Fe3+-hydroxamate transport system substrate-binding protein